MPSLHLRKTFVCAFFIFLIANEFDKEHVTCSASGMCHQYRPDPCSLYRGQRPQNLNSIPGEYSTVETNKTACRARCGAVNKCVYWSYWDDHRCYLSLGGEPLITVDEPVTTGKNPKLCGK